MIEFARNAAEFTGQPVWLIWVGMAYAAFGVFMAYSWAAMQWEIWRLKRRGFW
jgi:hypothetical protein